MAEGTCGVCGGGAKALDQNGICPDCRNGHPARVFQTAARVQPLSTLFLSPDSSGEAPSSPPKSIPDPLVNKVLGGCRLEYRIGGGGMGVVYRARQLSLDRLVAVKVIHPIHSGEQNSLQRFHHEARIIASLKHPNILQIFDIGQEEGHHYILMEFVEGPNLSRLIERNLHRDLPQCLEILAQILEGLGYAHRQRIIHRDLKPDNILLEHGTQVKLADFGLAKALASNLQLTFTGQVMGTPHYMSPEAALGEPVDQRADIYSLGATFYQVLTNTFAYTGSTPLKILYSHMHSPLKPLRELNPDVPDALAAIVERMMARERDERYGSCEEIEADLRELAAEELSDRSGEIELRGQKFEVTALGEFPTPVPVAAGSVASPAVVSGSSNTDGSGKSAPDALSGPPLPSGVLPVVVDPALQPVQPPEELALALPSAPQASITAVDGSPAAPQASTTGVDINRSELQSDSGARGVSGGATVVGAVLKGELSPPASVPVGSAVNQSASPSGGRGRLLLVIALLLVALASLLGWRSQMGSEAFDSMLSNLFSSQKAALPPEAPALVSETGLALEPKSPVSGDIGEPLAAEGKSAQGDTPSEAESELLMGDENWSSQLDLFRSHLQEGRLEEARSVLHTLTESQLAGPDDAREQLRELTGELELVGLTNRGTVFATHLETSSWGALAYFFPARDCLEEQWQKLKPKQVSRRLERVLFLPSISQLKGAAVESAGLGDGEKPAWILFSLGLRDSDKTRRASVTWARNCGRWRLAVESLP